MEFWVTHAGVILACDDGGKSPPLFFLRCGPAWYGWLILPPRCRRRGRKSCSRVRGNWLTDGMLWREACEVSGLSLRLSLCPHPLPSREGVSARSHHVSYILLCMSICASLAFLAQNCDWNSTKYAVCYWYSTLESHFLAKLFSHSLYRKKKNLKPWMMFFFSLFSDYLTAIQLEKHFHIKMDISMSNKNTLITSVPFLKNEILLIQSHRLTTNCAAGLYELQMTSVAVFCLTGNTAACWAKMTITNPVDWAGRLSGSS